MKSINLGRKQAKRRMLMLQLFAGFDDVVAANEKAFEGTTMKDSYAAISTKLGELGYDVLINNKSKAEYVPSARLSEVVGQRDTFKTQMTDLNKELEAMKVSAKANPELQAQIQAQLDKNTSLSKEMEGLRVQSEIIAYAKDAINAKDVVAFINMDNIKVNAKGEVMGVEAEIARLKTEKPYLFGEAQQQQDPKQQRRRGGMDINSGGQSQKLSMNAMIRQASGR